MHVGTIYGKISRNGVTSNTENIGTQKHHQIITHEAHTKLWRNLHTPAKSPKSFLVITNTSCTWACRRLQLQKCQPTAATMGNTNCIRFCSQFKWHWIAHCVVVWNENDPLLFSVDCISKSSKGTYKFSVNLTNFQNKSGQDGIIKRI